MQYAVFGFDLGTFFKETLALGNGLIPRRLMCSAGSKCDGGGQ